LILSYL